MARLNTRKPSLKTHEGGTAKHINAEQALRRSVMSCLLWEREFYEDGEKIADRIVRLSADVKASTVATIAMQARNEMKLRHVPLLLTAALAKQGRLNSGMVQHVVKRADELTELLAIHAKINGVGPGGLKPVLSHALKAGLAKAFHQFDEYQLAKYDRNKTGVRLRDVLRLVHPKPESKEQAELWGRLIKDELKTPDTWEVALSAGADKKETFTRLLEANKLGYMALLRNLRNMEQAGVDSNLIRRAILTGNAERVLPFRFVAAARAVPRYEKSLDATMARSIEALPELTGKTAVLVDVSGSMSTRLSAKSDLTRMDAAAALASIVNCEELRVFTFSYQVAEVPARRGMAGVDAVINSQPHGGTHLGAAVQVMNERVKPDRLIVITDEQSHYGSVPDPTMEKAYMINVASYKNGVGYGKWTHIDGFSESVVRFISELESTETI